MEPADYIIAETIFSIITYTLMTITVSIFNIPINKTRNMVINISVYGILALGISYITNMIIREIYPRGGVLGYIALGCSIMSGIIFIARSILQKRQSKIWLVLFLGFCLAILCLTVFIRFYIIKKYNIYYDPIQAFKLMLDQDTTKNIKHFVQNIIMFVPFGVIMSQIRTDGFLVLKATIVGAWFSSFIELTQLMLNKGECDILDLIGNTLGTLVGAGLGVFVSNLVAQRAKHSGSLIHENEKH